MSKVYKEDSIPTADSMRRIEVSADVGGIGKSAYQRVLVRLVNEGGHTVENIWFDPRDAVALADVLRDAVDEIKAT